MEKKILCTKCGQELDTTTVLDGLCPKCLMGAANGPTGDLNTIKMGNDADRTPDFSLEEIKKLFPNLEIIELLGRGGMGSVYKARQPSLDRLVALKIIHPRIAQSPEFIERFKREAQTLAKLNHPNIVTVHDFGTSGNVCHLIMEYIDGVNLRQAIRQASLKPNEVLEIVMRICDALQFAHEEGVVHRDIKPENILLDLKNRVKIVDFGLAKLVAGKNDGFSLTEAGKTMGTPDYMAPEQREQFKEVDQRADIYSLGVVFYEMLTGQLPIGRFMPPSKKVQMDVRIDEVVLRTLENEPEMRYQQASQVKKDVQTIVTNTAGNANIPHAIPSDSKSIPSYWIPTGILLLMAPILITFGWFAQETFIWIMIGVIFLFIVQYILKNINSSKNKDINFNLTQDNPVIPHVIPSDSKKQASNSNGSGCLKIFLIVAGIIIAVAIILFVAFLTLVLTAKPKLLTDKHSYTTTVTNGANNNVVASVNGNIVRSYKKSTDVSGKIITQIRNVSNFEKIDFNGAGDLFIEQGDVEELEIEAEEKLMGDITTEVVDGTLRIGTKTNDSINISFNGKSILGNNLIKYNLKVKNLKSLDVKGLGDVHVEKLTAENLSLKCSGSGDITIGYLTAKSLESVISGSGNFNIAGKVESQKIQITGSGDYTCPGLKSSSATVTVRGSGDAEVSASELLDVNISGSGDVTYHGNPKLSSNITGSGDVTKN